MAGECWEEATHLWALSFSALILQGYKKKNRTVGTNKENKGTSQYLIPLSSVRLEKAGGEQELNKNPWDIWKTTKHHLT